MVGGRSGGQVSQTVRAGNDCTALRLYLSSSTLSLVALSVPAYCSLLLISSNLYFNNSYRILDKGTKYWNILEMALNYEEVRERHFCGVRKIGGDGGKELRSETARNMQTRCARTEQQ